MKQQQQIIMFVLVVIILAVVIYYSMNQKKTTNTKPTGTIDKNTKKATATKPKNPANGDEIDSSGNVEVGMDVVANYDITVPLVKLGPGPSVVYLPATNLFNSDQKTEDFLAWDDIGTITAIYDEGDDNVSAIIVAGTGLMGEFYKVSVYDVQQQ